jgi:tetratricopeptide (TPR) repeat protein
MSTGSIIALTLTLAAGQTVADVRQLYDAGRYQEVVRATDHVAAEADTASRMQFLAAQSLAKLKDDEGARRAYLRVAESRENPWGAIGKSAVQEMDNQLDEALASADQAVSQGGSVPEAHYQRGMVLMMRRDYGEAANAFAKAVQLDPAFAAAYYYAGLANSRIKRVDLTANNYEMFLKLAPNAPERPQVESILRTIRGR